MTLPNKFSVYAETIEEAREIQKMQMELCAGCRPIASNMYYRFDPNDPASKFGYDRNSYLSDVMEDFGIIHEYTCQQFKELCQK